MAIDWDKPLRTKDDHRKAMLVYQGVKNAAGFTNLVLVEDKDVINQTPMLFTEQGRSFTYTPTLLENVPEVKTLYVNLYPDGPGQEVFSDIVQAVQMGGSHKVAVLKLSYENGIPVKAEISLKNRIEADSVTASRLAC